MAVTAGPFVSRSTSRWTRGPLPSSTITPAQFLSTSPAMSHLCRFDRGLGLQLMQPVNAGHFDEVGKAPDRTGPKPDGGVRVERYAAVGRERHVGEAGDIGDRRPVRCEEPHAAN